MCAGICNSIPAFEVDKNNVNFPQCFSFTYVANTVAKSWTDRAKENKKQSADARVVGLESWTWTQVGLESDFLRTWTGLGLEGQGLGLGLEG